MGTHNFNTTPGFDEKHALHELKHYLPSQTPLKDFIHHNMLHAFQSEKFYDAIQRASVLFGYQSALPLHEFRQLYKIGRIRKDILERTILENKGKEQLEQFYGGLVLKADTHLSFGKIVTENNCCVVELIAVSPQAPDRPQYAIDIVEMNAAGKIQCLSVYYRNFDLK